ncbi:MAG: Hsp20/alpha crystallin family protein [Chloroflexota bacterium]
MSMERWRPQWGLTPWRPFRELEEMGRRFEDLFGRSLFPAVMRPWTREAGPWMPAIEVMEKDDNYVVKAELPGTKQEDIDVSVVGDSLVIRGEKRSESEVREEDYYTRECSYGSFSRSISLPSNANTGKIEASFEDGVLEITIPETAEVKAKKVAVSPKKEKPAAKKTGTKKTGAKKTTGKAAKSST